MGFTIFFDWSSHAFFDLGKTLLYQHDELDILIAD
jgi:hypothetical protein